ncbi:class I histocompatibility antigen, F10 alpha chain-like isoform X2 [Phycodurus eques]|uniref:class I histocompatibility antigen, F10 alpha chain-like isoform X2 n=1 Tax=Phycodurus eques TaxID=693459 RepID=UPI002ACEF70D|nr:class I histocompatibility antigen, F10 alpha chain-like isoform X2 [Phycodurus eques]
MNKVASFQILLVCSHVASAALHSLWHVYTVSSGIPRLPPVTAAVLVDGVTTEHYDSRAGTAVAKQAWMDAVLRRHPDYWKEQTAFWQGQEHFGNINMAILLDRFNQSDGVHVFQVLHGCECDGDECGDVSGFNRHSYDGDTTLVLDVERRAWMALKPQLEPTGRKWNLNEGWLEFMEHRLLRECPRRLRETLQYGKDVLRRIHGAVGARHVPCLGFPPRQGGRVLDARRRAAPRRPRGARSDAPQPRRDLPARRPPARRRRAARRLAPLRLRLPARWTSRDDRHRAGRRRDQNELRQASGSHRRLRGRRCVRRRPGGVGGRRHFRPQEETT